MSETKRGWCPSCDSEETFYLNGDQFVCSMCEKPGPVPTLEEVKAAAEAHGLNAPEGATVEDAEVLIDDLDHIRIQLKGPWTNDDLQALAAGMQASSDAAREDGLGLDFFAIRKSAAEQARSMGALVVPFRDRHGRIIPGRALSLKPSGPSSVPGPSSKIILPGQP